MQTEDLEARRLLKECMKRGIESIENSTAMSTREREKALLSWLEDNGMYLSAASGWGRAGHGVRVESETTEDFEPSGRGLIARKGINQGEPLMEINTRLVMTRDTAIAEKVPSCGISLCV